VTIIICIVAFVAGLFVPVLYRRARERVIAWAKEADKWIQGPDQF